MAVGFSINHDKTRKIEQKRIGKDEVASSNLAISSIAPRDVVSMAPGVFFMSVFRIFFILQIQKGKTKGKTLGKKTTREL